MSERDVRQRADQGRVVNLPSEISAVALEAFLMTKIPPRETLLAPWLAAQSIGMIFAQRGVGKTHFGAAVAYAVASGGKFLKWQAPKPRRVLYVDGEMAAVIMQERLAGIAAGADREPPKDFFRLVTPDLQESFIPDLATIEGQEAADRILAGAEFVVFDNISSLFRSGEENTAESWATAQAWALSLRRRGVSSLFIHHAGKGGQQRGTSRREDVMDTIVALRRPTDYRSVEGARFEIHFEKARGLCGEDTEPFEVRLETIDGVGIWTMKNVEDTTTQRVAECLDLGLTIREVASELGISRSATHRHKKKAVELGFLSSDDIP